MLRFYPRLTLNFQALLFFESSLCNSDMEMELNITDSLGAMLCPELWGFSNRESQGPAFKK